MKTPINNLSQEIKQQYKNEKKKAVRKNIIPDYSKSLWDAVNVAKNINCNKVPTNMHNGKLFLLSSYTSLLNPSAYLVVLGSFLTLFVVLVREGLDVW